MQIIGPSHASSLGRLAHALAVPVYYEEEVDKIEVSRPMQKGGGS